LIGHQKNGAANAAVGCPNFLGDRLTIEAEYRFACYMANNEQEFKAASPSSVQNGEHNIIVCEPSDPNSSDSRNMRRMSLTDSTKSAKVRYRNSASLSPSLNRRRMSPSSPNLNNIPGASLLSSKEITRIAPYTSNSFDMLDTIGNMDSSDSPPPVPGKTISTPPIVGKKKRKHKSNKSTQFTPPQSPVSTQRRTSLNTFVQDVTDENGQPLTTNGQGKRVENYNSQHMRSNPPKYRKSLIARAADDSNDTSNLARAENKENCSPSVTSEKSKGNEGKAGHSEDTFKGNPNQKPVEEEPKDQPSNKPSFSIWDYLKDELTASDFDSAQDLKRERITNLLGVPGAVEKVSLKSSYGHCFLANH
jgi:hypothetical protein